jgi:hypothetical protein
MYCYLYGESDQKVNSNSPVIKRTQLNLSTNIISTVEIILRLLNHDQYYFCLVTKS